MSGWSNIRGNSGPGENLSWVGGGGVYCTALLPDARAANNGDHPILIDRVELYMAGRFGAVDVRVFASVSDGSSRAQSSLFSIPAQYPVTTLRGAAISRPFRNATGQAFRIGTSAGDLVTYGRHAEGATNIVTAGGDTWQANYALAGRYRWYESPSAARNVEASALSSSTVRVEWDAPSDDGGTDITGYRVQRSKSATFASGVTSVDVSASARRVDMTGLPPGTWYVRVFSKNAVTSQYGTYSVASATDSTTLVAPPSEPGDLDGWESFGGLPAGMAGETTAGIRRMQKRFTAGFLDGLIRRNFVTAGTVTLTTDTYGIRRQVAGLVVGKTYRVSAKAIYDSTAVNSSSPNVYQLGAEGYGWAEPATLAVAGTSYSLPSYEFVAAAETAWLAIRLAESATRTGYSEMESTFFYGIELAEMPSDSPYRLQSVAFEGSLMDHFDLANNSVGALWYVDRAGVTQFLAELGSSPVVATFTDQRSEGKLEYVGISRSLDTRQIVNDLDVAQHGAILGEDGWETNDYSVNVKDQTSIATYGARRATFDMSLYDAGAFAGSVAARAAEIIGSAAPVNQVTAIRWNAQESPALAAALEVYSRVVVEYRGETYQCRIVGMSHEISPTRWMIDLYLIGG